MATKVKPNAATQAIRDERAVAKAKGERYTPPATKEARAAVKPVNAATQASRVERASINRKAAEATAQTEMNRKAATDTEGNVGDYKTVARPARYVGNATAAAASGKTVKPNARTQVIRNDRAKIAAAGGRYTRSTSGLSKQAIALRKNAGVNERLVSLRNSKKSIPKKGA